MGFPRNARGSDGFTLKINDTTGEITFTVTPPLQISGVNFSENPGNNKTPPRSGGIFFGNNKPPPRSGGKFSNNKILPRSGGENFGLEKNPGKFCPLEGPFEGFFVPQFGTLVFRKLRMVRRHLFILAAILQTFSCLHLYFMTLRVTNPTNDVLRPITERSRKVQTSKNRNPATLPQRPNPLTPCY